MRHLRLANFPERAAAGAFILNSGLTKLKADKDTAGTLHGMASGTYPFLKEVPPEGFTKALGMTEVALGSALLVPLIGDGLAGAALTAFAGGLFGLYLKTPGMRQEGGIRPSQEGIALAKDTWLLGIGVSLMGHSVGARRQARQIGKAKEKLDRATERHDKKDKRHQKDMRSSAKAKAKKAAKAAATAGAAKKVASAITNRGD
ncbi:MAG: hypothetical protein ACRDYZ_00600 [Acidimicrobiales bacterium]